MFENTENLLNCENKEKIMLNHKKSFSSKQR